MKRDRDKPQFVNEGEQVGLSRNMNKLVSDRGREQLEIAFAQQWLRQNDGGTKEPDSDGHRQRFRAKYFYFARVRADCEFAATNDFCDSIVRFELDRVVTDAACCLPSPK